MQYALSVVFGAIVGFALGLTGGGGSMLAVPLLVYGLSMTPREAVGVSLAAVGGTAAFGVLSRVRSGQVDFSAGLLFALAGMVGAPIGTWIARRIDGDVLLLAFAGLMLVVATRMWQGATRGERNAKAAGSPSDDLRASEDQRSADAMPRFSARQAALLLIVGFLTGVMSGFLGVGGGFVIIPALIFFGGMPIHLAVGTSLLVIALISLSGVTSHVVAGRVLSFEVTVFFVGGGGLGAILGTRLSQRLSGPRLQKIFSAGVIAVAVFIVTKTLV